MAARPSLPQDITDSITAIRPTGMHTFLSLLDRVKVNFSGHLLMRGKVMCFASATAREQKQAAQSTVWTSNFLRSRYEHVRLSSHCVRPFRFYQPTWNAVGGMAWGSPAEGCCVVFLQGHSLLVVRGQKAEKLRTKRRVALVAERHCPKETNESSERTRIHSAPLLGGAERLSNDESCTDDSIRSFDSAFRR